MMGAKKLKSLASLVVLCMLLTMLPVSTFAVDAQINTAAIVGVTEPVNLGAKTITTINAP